MQPQELKQLVEKYYEGLTSLDEERQLLAWLQSSQEAEQYADVMEQLEIMQHLNLDLETDAGFDRKILTAINTEQPTKKRWLQISYRMTGIAAAVLVFFAVWIGSELVKPTEVYGTINDPKLAFNETTRLLSRVTKSINKGLAPAQQSAERMVNGIEKVEKAVGKSNQLKQVDKASQYLNSFTRVYVNLGSNNKDKN